MTYVVLPMYERGIIMPKYTKSTDKSNEVMDDVVETTPTTEIKNYDAEIAELKKTNADLLDKMSQLMNTITSLQNQPVQTTTWTTPAISKEKTIDIGSEFEHDYVPAEINPNKQIMVMSLCYGVLSLTDDSGMRTLLKFSEYGETRPVLYSTLLDIVNSNLRFAQTGRFYILDKDAVYHLGLSEYYKTLIPREIIDNILTYSLNSIEGIMKSINKEQTDTLIRMLIDRVYNGEDVDINKIVFIGKLANVDIMEKVNEMKQYEKK